MPDPQAAQAVGPRPSQVSDADKALPPALVRGEQTLLSARAGAVAGALEGLPTIGVALSGGGVRSATFALGFFQALAKARLLSHIDYLSTVSGGGYFGGFLGRLFRQPYVENVADVEQVLQGKKEPWVMRYLRENARYLAPAGSDDLLLGGAVLLRNWLTVLLILLTTAFGMLCAFHMAVLLLLSTSAALAKACAAFANQFAAHGVLLSPFLLLPWGLLLLTVLPLGWCYWTIERSRAPRWGAEWLRPWVGRAWASLPHALVIVAGGLLIANGSETAGIVVCVVSVLAFAAAAAATALPRFMLAVPFMVFGCGLLVGLWLDATWPWKWVAPPSALAAALLGLTVVTDGPKASAAVGFVSDELDQDSHGRHAVSNALKTALLWTAGFALLGVIDSAARSLYRAYEARELLTAGGGVLAFFTFAAGVGQRLSALFGQGEKSGQRLSLSGAAASRVAAVVVVVSLLLMLDLGANAILGTVEVGAAEPQASTTKTLLDSEDGFAGSVALVVTEPKPKKQAALVTTPAQPNMRAAFAAVFATLVLSLLFGTARGMLNRSTQHALYAARLTRTYLGASNPDRGRGTAASAQSAAHKAMASMSMAHQPDPEAATRVMPGDDIAAADYFAWPSSKHAAPSHYGKGAPLHLVNVTINETVDGRSQIQQGDRKGLGLAIGPCGFSAGVQHHVVFAGTADAAPEVFPKSGWKVFRFAGDKDAKQFPADHLSLGQWLGISGAAFSTGLGARTNLGLSLLAGLANIRLGYWWKPGISWPITLGRVLSAPFWVQSYLFRELLARFPGTANSLWYLSDGGHFENLGGYELIRRRVRYLLIVDAEADPDYAFEGLANLVRKARLDFGADITFFEEPPAELGDTWPKYVGSLSSLRRGPDRTGTSRAHAALAKITYAGDAEPAFLLYVKPTLLGDETADLEHYHGEHPDFPHEPTADQFFDEAQWESYRKLGELIGERLIGPRAPEGEPQAKPG
jgi:hypothetical protein